MEIHPAKTSRQQFELVLRSAAFSDQFPNLFSKLPTTFPQTPLGKDGTTTVICIDRYNHQTSQICAKYVKLIVLKTSMTDYPFLNIGGNVSTLYFKAFCVMKLLSQKKYLFYIQFYNSTLNSPLLTLIKFRQHILTY